jgi:hypothetical protein
MPRTRNAVCPHCGAPLKSGRGVRVGKTVHCPRCAAAFVVRGDEAARAPKARPWAPPTSLARQETGGKIDGSRLVLVMFVALVSLLGGGALAGYCVARSAPRPPAPPPPAVVQAARPAGDAGGDATPPHRPGPSP